MLQDVTEGHFQSQSRYVLHSKQI